MLTVRIYVTRPSGHIVPLKSSPCVWSDLCDVKCHSPKSFCFVLSANSNSQASNTLLVCFCNLSSKRWSTDALDLSFGSLPEVIFRSLSIRMAFIWVISSVYIITWCPSFDKWLFARAKDAAIIFVQELGFFGPHMAISWSPKYYQTILCKKEDFKHSRWGF